MDIATLHSYVFDASRLAPSVLAAFLALAVGALPFLRGYGLPYVWHILGPVMRAISDRLDRRDRGEGVLIRRGRFVVAFWFLVGLSAGYLLLQLVPPKLHMPFQICVLALCVMPGGLWMQMIQLSKGFRDNAVPQGAIYKLTKLSGLAMGSQDDATIMRLTLVMMVRLLDKALISPILWFLIGGLPVLIAVSFAQACTWFDGRDGKTAFGQGVYDLEKLIGVVPTWLSGFFVSCAAFVAPKASITRAFLSRLIKGDKAPYEEGGSGVTNLAYTLGVALGGPVNDTKGFLRGLAWVGPVVGSARISVEIFAHGIYLLAIFAALWGATILGAAVWS